MGLVDYGFYILGIIYSCKLSFFLGRKLASFLFGNCVFSHRYQVKKDSGVYRYLECQDCGAREVEKYISGYQPVDRTWIDE